MIARTWILVAATVTLAVACLYGGGSGGDAGAHADSEGGAQSDDARGGQDTGAQSLDSASEAGTDSGTQMFHTCIPTSCFESCGTVPNGCGGMMQCGPCPTGETCNGAGHCVPADGGGPDGCAPACTGGLVCVSTQTVGGCTTCSPGPIRYACGGLPAACGSTVDCACAKSLCPSPYTCQSASASQVVCIQTVP